MSTGNPAGTASPTHRASDGPQTTAAGRAPVAPPAATLAGLVLALLMIAVGVVGIRDALVAANVLSGRSWTGWAADTLDGLTAQDWMIPVGAVACLIGLWLLLVAVKPRRRTEVQVGDSDLVWIKPNDVARLAKDAAEDVDGVIAARSSASRRAVTVHAQATATDDGFSGQIRDAVAARLSAVRPSPEVKVRAKAPGGGW